MRPFLFKLSILCGILFALPQCAHIKKPTSLSISQVCSAQKILQEFKEEESAFTCLRGIAKIRVESPEEKFSVKEIIIAKKPKSLRLETLSPLGRPVFFILTDGEELSLFSPSENRFYQGVASSKNVSLFFHVNLDLEEMISILQGKVALIEYDTEQVACRASGNYCVLTLYSRDRKFTQVIKISLSEQKAVESEIYKQGEGLILMASYTHYERVGETTFPREVTVVLPRDEKRVKIHYKEIELLSEIHPDQFRLTPPHGIEVLPLEE